MSNLTTYIPRIQFEIRYTYILNFNSIIREIASPFLRLADSLSFQNQGYPDESITLEFNNDFFSMECRWDRLIFVSEYDLDRIKSKNDPTHVFFQVLDQIAGKETFGKFTNSVFQTTFVKPSNESYDTILANFKDQYLNKHSIDQLLKDPDDIGLNIEKNDNEKGKKTAVRYGPFHPNDIKRQNLLPFAETHSHLDNLKETYGFFKVVNIFNPTDQFDHDYVKKQIDETKKIGLNNG